MSTLTRTLNLPSETVLSRQASSLSPQNLSLSSAQNTVDFLVSHGITEASRGSTLISMLGAGWAFRFTRAGLLPLASLAEGKPVYSALLRGGSYAIALANESAAFAGIERGIRRLEGETVPTHFKKEWARAAINLGGLKLFGGMTQTENLIVQHLFTDVAMVGGHQLGAAWGLTEKPQGSWAEQMIEAETLNWSMKAGMKLLWGLSPGLLAAERSFDLRLRIQQPFLSEKRMDGFPFYPKLLQATAGASEAPVTPPKEAERTRGIKVIMMSGESNGGDGSDEPTRIMDSGRVISAIPIPGQLIDGRYIVEKFLGSGAMGAVFLCRHQDLLKKVAMKVLTADLSRDPNATKRFLTEARAASSIGNPHITDVSDFGKLPDGSTYFIMEHLSGAALADILHGQQPVPAPRLLHIARQLAVGLGAAHRAGIVHRDLKPENIFLIDRDLEKDFVKILDFGIAKVAGSPESKLTMEGLVFGTPYYLSPEQATGKSVDQRSDIYAYGVVLYEMAAGKVPFSADEVQGILTMHVAIEPSPIHEMATQPIELPRGLEAIIMKCLAKDPADRYQSMEEVIADLDKVKVGALPQAAIEMSTKTEIIQRTQIVTRLESEPKPRRSNWPMVAGFAGGGAIIAVLAALLVMKNQAASPTLPPPTPDAMPPQPSPISPDAAPPPVIKKEVTLTMQPADAHAFLGDKDLGASPVKIEVEEGSTTELEIRRKGFKTRKMTLDGTLEKASIRLERERTNRPHRPPHTPNPPDQTKPPNNPNDLDNPWKKKEEKKQQGSGSKK